MIHQDYQVGAAEARTFFDTLFHKLGAQERIEVRYKSAGSGQMQREFFRGPEEAMSFALRLGQSHDMYVGVAPRQGNVGTKDGVTRLFAVWGDLDAKGEHTSETRLEQVRGLSCPPSMLVWSGGGYHPYWMLIEPAQGTEDLARAERVMQRIAEGLDGDKVHDRSRILRVPGTLNNKQDEPRPVRVVDHDPKQLYTLDQLERMVEPWVKAEKKTTHENESRISREVAGRFLEGSRNNVLTSLAGGMRHKGMSEKAILAALRAENENRCEPPLPEAEVCAIARSIGKYEAGDLLYKLSNSTVFPIEVLPPTLMRYVKEASASIGCPMDFIGVSSLATLGAAIGNSRVLEVKGGWVEGATLYTVIVGDPGAAKSPALDAATFPALKKQEELGREYREALSEYRDNDPENDAEEPVYQRAVVQDTTIEALTERLNDNPRGLLSSNDELSGWIRQMDQYKSGDKGTDRQFWLSAWSNRYVSVDRKGRKEPLMVHRPFVAVAGGIQPGILSELKNNREDGLLDRFLFGYPDPMPHRWSDIEISEESRAAYKDIYDELYGLEMDTDENGTPDPIRATFTASAKQLFIQEYDSLYEEIQHPNFPVHLKGPWKKMVAYLARLSLILALADTVEPRHPRYGEAFYAIAKSNPTITDKHIGAAIALIDYFKAHTRKVYAKLPGTGKNSTKQANADKGDEPNRGSSVARFLARFLEERGGYWKGMTSELYKICTENAISDLPGGVGPFGKKIRKIAKDPDSGFTLKEGHSRKQHIITLSLSTLGTVGNAEDTYTESTKGTEGKNESSSVEHAQMSNQEKDRTFEIANAMDSLFEKHQGHEESRDTYDIATELFLYGYLDFIPEEDEVSLALDVLNSTGRI